MPDHPEPDRELMASVADAIGIDVSDDVRSACLDIAADHEAGAASLGGAVNDGPDPDELPGAVQSDDRYNALLAVYDEPRSATDGGPLSGLTVAVKDNLAAAGLPMTCGSAAFEVVPGFDAAAVERLLAAGAALVGKANMEPFALGPTGEFSGFGVVENPRFEGRIPGGSSSGSAAAVAAGLVDAALGSDTGGSVRIPAACCGLVGVKPTHGLVPQHGFVNLGVSMDAVGPLARDVDAATRVLDAIAGFDPRDPTSARRGRPTPLPDRVDRVADGAASDPVVLGLPDGLVDPAREQVRAVFDAAVGRLREDPAVEVRPVPLDLGELENAFFHLNVVEFGWLLRQTGVARGLGTGFEEELREAFECMLAGRPSSEHLARRVLPSMFLDAKTDGAAYTAARAEALAFGRRLAARFESVDALVAPTLRTVPPAYDRSKSKAGAIRDLASNTLPFNASGNPAVTVPVGTAGGLPVSAQVAAPQFAADRALFVARRLEAVAE